MLPKRTDQLTQTDLSETKVHPTFKDEKFKKELAERAKIVKHRSDLERQNRELHHRNSELQQELQAVNARLTQKVTQIDELEAKNAKLKFQKSAYKLELHQEQRLSYDLFEGGLLQNKQLKKLRADQLKRHVQSKNQKKDIKKLEHQVAELKDRLDKRSKNTRQVMISLRDHIQQNRSSVDPLASAPILWPTKSSIESKQDLSVQLPASSPQNSETSSSSSEDYEKIQISPKSLGNKLFIAKPETPVRENEAKIDSKRTITPSGR